MKSEFYQAALWTVVMVLSCSCKTTSGGLIEPHKQPLAAVTTDQSLSLLKDSTTWEQLRRIESELRQAEVADELVYEKHLNLAQINLWTGRWSEAWQDTQNAIAKNPRSPAARRVQAQVFYRQDKMDLAELVLLRMDEELYKDAEALNLMALISYRRSQPSQALHYFKMAVELNPQHLGARLNLASLYLSYRQLHPAAVQFERALKIDPENLDAQLQLAIVNYALGGNASEATQIYTKVLRRNPNHPIALFNLAMIEADQQKFRDAIARLKQYLTTDFAKSANNRDVLEWIHSFEQQQIALEQAPSDQEIQKMASDLKKAAPSAKQASSVFGSTESKQAPSASANSPSPEASPAPADTQPLKSKSKRAPVDADIELLQRELNR